MQKDSKIEVTLRHMRSTFRGWIAKYGGVVLWESGVGLVFSPALDLEGNPCGAPMPHYEYKGTIRDIEAFSFPEDRGDGRQGSRLQPAN